MILMRKTGQVHCGGANGPVVPFQPLHLICVWAFALREVQIPFFRVDGFSFGVWMVVKIMVPFWIRIIIQYDT